MVSHHQIGSIAPGLASGQLQTFKCLGTGYFMHQMTVNIENRGAIFGGVYHMGLPEFVVESLGHDENAVIHVFCNRNSLRLCHISALQQAKMG